jgi:hypothetical protein
MIKPQRKHNIKNSYVPKFDDSSSQDVFKNWLNKVVYEGSPHHKRNPSDFGLTPPAALKQDKTPCDNVVSSLSIAHSLLLNGIKRRLVSKAQQHGWPKEVWSVDKNGIPFEAKLTRAGYYHGYPLLKEESHYQFIIDQWEKRKDLL